MYEQKRELYIHIYMCTHICGYVIMIFKAQGTPILILTCFSEHFLNTLRIFLGFSVTIESRTKVILSKAGNM
jgi:hypothetical protein